MEATIAIDVMGFYMSLRLYQITGCECLQPLQVLLHAENSLISSLRNSWSDGLMGKNTNLKNMLVVLGMAVKPTDINPLDRKSLTSTFKSFSFLLQVY